MLLNSLRFIRGVSIFEEPGHCIALWPLGGDLQSNTKLHILLPLENLFIFIMSLILGSLTWKIRTRIESTSESLAEDKMIKQDNVNRMLLSPGHQPSPVGKHLGGIITLIIVTIFILLPSWHFWLARTKAVDHLYQVKSLYGQNNLNFVFTYFSLEPIVSFTPF